MFPTRLFNSEHHPNQAIFHTSLASLASPFPSGLHTCTQKGKASDHSVFQVAKSVIVTQVESVNRQLQCNSSTVKRKINLSKFLFLSPRENYFLYQLAIQIKVSFQMILCSNYEIVSVLSHSVT